MRMMLALAVLLGVAGVGRAGDKEIVNRLQEKGHIRMSVSNRDTTRFLGLDEEFDDKDLGDLCELRDLEALVLIGPGITDASLRHIGGLRGLTHLDLTCTAVSDAGLRHLEGLRGLNKLFLWGCPTVTDEGVARLQKALPKCSIVR
jgi:hypothetical protein